MALGVVSDFDNYGNVIENVLLDIFPPKFNSWLNIDGRNDLNSFDSACACLYESGRSIFADVNIWGNRNTKAKVYELVESRAYYWFWVRSACFVI